MEPAINIISYLWDARTTWLKHHDECGCQFPRLAYDFLDRLEVSTYMEVAETDEGPVMVELHHTRKEWDELCGPSAQAQIMNAQAEALTDQAANWFNAALNLQQYQEA